jgi:hypothetical protein
MIIRINGYPMIINSLKRRPKIIELQTRLFSVELAEEFVELLANNYVQLAEVRDSSFDGLYFITSVSLAPGRTSAEVSLQLAAKQSFFTAATESTELPVHITDVLYATDTGITINDWICSSSLWGVTGSTVYWKGIASVVGYCFFAGYSLTDTYQFNYRFMPGVSIEADVKLDELETDQIGGLCARMQGDAENTTGMQTGLVFLIINDSGSSWLAAGSVSERDDFEYFRKKPIAAYEEYVNLRLEVVGGRMSCYYEGELFYAGPAFFSLAGYVGMVGSQQSAVYFDNILIRSIIPQTTVVSGGAQLVNDSKFVAGTSRGNIIHCNSDAKITDILDIHRPDVVVWDTRGDTSLQLPLLWRRVADAGHIFTGDMVIENGLVWLRCNKQTGELTYGSLYEDLALPPLYLPNDIHGYPSPADWSRMTVRSPKGDANVDQLTFTTTKHYSKGRITGAANEKFDITNDEGMQSCGIPYVSIMAKNLSGQMTPVHTTGYYTNTAYIINRTTDGIYQQYYDGNITCRNEKQYDDRFTDTKKWHQHGWLTELTDVYFITDGLVDYVARDSRAMPEAAVTDIAINDSSKFWSLTTGECELAEARVENLGLLDYRRKALCDCLVSWRFDNRYFVGDSGTYEYYKAEGTMTGDATTLVVTPSTALGCGPGREGLHKQAYVFGESTSLFNYMRTKTTSTNYNIVADTELTIEFVVGLEAAGTAQNHVFVQTQNAGTSYPGSWKFELNNSSSKTAALTFWVYFTGGSVYKTSTDTMWDDFVYHHVAGVVSGGRMYLYIDYKLVDSAALVTTGMTATARTIQVNASGTYSCASVISYLTVTGRRLYPHQFGMVPENPTRRPYYLKSQFDTRLPYPYPRSIKRDPLVWVPFDNTLKDLITNTSLTVGDDYSLNYGGTGLALYGFWNTSGTTTSLAAPYSTGRQLEAFTVQFYVTMDHATNLFYGPRIGSSETGDFCTILFNYNNFGLFLTFTGKGSSGTVSFAYNLSSFTADQTYHIAIVSKGNWLGGSSELPDIDLYIDGVSTAYKARAFSSQNNWEAGAGIVSCLDDPIYFFGGSGSGNTNALGISHFALYDRKLSTHELGVFVDFDNKRGFTLNEIGSLSDHTANMDLQLTEVGTSHVSLQSKTTADGWYTAKAAYPGIAKASATIEVEAGLAGFRVFADKGTVNTLLDFTNRPMRFASGITAQSAGYPYSDANLNWQTIR